MFYDRFLNACKLKSQSPSSVALAIGASKSNVTNWKNGASPSAETILKASDYLGVSTDYLLGVTDVIMPEAPIFFSNLIWFLSEKMSTARDLNQMILNYNKMANEKNNLDQLENERAKVEEAFSKNMFIYACYQIAKLNEKSLKEICNYADYLKYKENKKSNDLKDEK